ncbi:hypothetical protein HPB48_012100 [Haemaphysalis longicornis]|uniref:Uncharacterized protein n=1 Tax=Haemaphysalis longicornis TaxID=44386 RepID=A0A9J6GMN9_HAELO|nr:hypothetical protein HPB48_012100 [Haemaphysalis longicornis]
MKLPRYLEDLYQTYPTIIVKAVKDKHNYLHYNSYSTPKRGRYCNHARPNGSCFYVCVERVLQEQETLQLLFLQASMEDLIVAVESNLQHISCVTEAYCRFIKHVANLFNRINALFQSNRNLIAELQAESPLRCPLQNFVQYSTLERDDINPTDPRVNC